MRMSPLLLVLALTAPPLAAEEAAAPGPAAPRPAATEILVGELAGARSFPGLIAAATETALAFQTAGQLMERDADLGDRVAAGQVLARLDRITLTEDLAAARADLAAAGAQAEFAGQTLDRVEALIQRDVASAAQQEQASAAHAAALAAARAAEARVAAAEDALRFADLTAPADGVVVAVLAEAGAIVTPGTPILRIASLEGREALIDVPSEALAILPPGARFVVTPRGAAGSPVGGRLSLIEPVADGATRSHRLRIALDEGGRGLRLGALVTVTLDAAAEPVLTLPPEAVVTGADGSAGVWRLDADRRLTRVAVTLGPELDGRVVVASGLQPGDEILVRGVNSVTEGQELGERIAP